MKKVIFAFFVSGLLVFSSLVVAQGTYILNGSFENIVAGRPAVKGRNPDGMRYWMRWTLTNNERSDELAKEGKHSFKVFGNSGAYQDFLNPVDQNKTYTASCYILTPAGNSLSGGAFAVLKLEWLTRLRRNLFDETMESRRFDANMQPGEWHKVTVSGKPPRNAKYGRVTVEYRGAAKDGVVFFDDVKVGIVQEDKGQAPQTGNKQEDKEEKEKKPTPDDEIDWQW